MSPKAKELFDKIVSLLNDSSGRITAHDYKELLEALANECECRVDTFDEEDEEDVDVDEEEEEDIDDQ